MRSTDMGRTRRWATIVACALACVPVLLLGALPALGWHLTGPTRLWGDHSAWVAQRPQLHRGSKVIVTGVVQEPLRPGVTTPIALTLKNPNRSVVMNRVRVLIAGI